MERMNRPLSRRIGPIRAIAGVGARCAVALALATGVTTASAQTLDLDGVRAGPRLPAENGALDLAQALEDERSALEAASAGFRDEARASAHARMRLRQVAVSLLRSGANRPWSESAPTVLGLRVANLLRPADAAIEAAAAGRRLRDGRPLPEIDARKALEAVALLGAAPLDRLHAAVRGDAADPAKIISELARVLGPLAVIVGIVEEAEPANPWPPDLRTPSGAAAASPRASPEASVPASLALDSLRARLARLEAGCAQASRDDGCRAALAPIGAIIARAAADPVADRALLRGVAAALRLAEWIASAEATPPPRPIDEATIALVRSRLASAAEAGARALAAEAEERDPTDASAPPEEREPSMDDRDGAGHAEGSRTLAELVALEAIVDACDGMLAVRRMQASSDLARKALSEAIAALVAAADRGGASARAAVRAAARIAEACAAAERLERGAAGEAPREYREVVRALDREARIALRALPDAFRNLASEPARATDPGALAPLTRVQTLDADRARIVAMQGLVARIAAVRPRATQAIEGSTRRLARLLLDPIKRSDAQRGFASVEAMAEAAFPLPFEDELLRRSDRAMALTTGQPERVLEIAAEARIAWAEAVARGDLGGEDAVWLDEVARFLGALRDLSALSAPVTRAEADRLASWGGWASRRALIAPATVDLEARAGLAARSLVASAASGDRRDFRRDLAALERGLPLVRLVARLERAIAPALDAVPSTTAAMLAPLVHGPGPDAAFVREWPRLLMLDRALIESEYARRKGTTALRDELALFMAELARDIEVGAFGAAAAIAAVPGFDGSVEDGPTGGRAPAAPRREPPATRRR